MNSQLIKMKIDELPKDLRKEALDFIEYLLAKSGKGENKGKFRFDWESGLGELKNKFSSVELQHKASEWR